mgnify:CR=1 FL=1|tara:strand:- start:10228 stop:11436 length:1209 start_codon:yes stop_codon:yes gene_type:complete
MDQVNNKSICPYAFRGAMINVDSTVKPCCRYQQRYGSARVKVTDTFSIHDAFHSQYYQDLRKKMLAGEKVPGCVRCYKEEEAGQKSMRNDNTLLTASTDIELEYLEVESGRHCNLKCRSCNPELSSGWNEDIKNNNELATEYGFNDQLDELESFMYNDGLEHVSKENCIKLKTIKATGGEPFLSKSFLKLIDNLDKWDLAKNIKLEVYTNVSFMPKPKFVEALLKLKTVELNMSIDSIGKRNDYLRSNSDWDTTNRVVDYWCKLASEHPNKVRLVVSNTVSILNVLTLNLLISYVANKEKQFGVYTDISHTVVHWPKYLAVYNFPRNIKDKIIKSIKEIPSTTNIPNYKALGVQRIIGMLERSTPTTVSAKKDFIYTTDSIDKVRDESWKTVFPEVLKLLRG